MSVFFKYKDNYSLLLILFLPLSWAAFFAGSFYRWVILIVFAYCIFINRFKIKIAVSSNKVFSSFLFLIIYVFFTAFWGNNFKESIISISQFILMLLVSLVFVSEVEDKKTFSNQLDNVWILVGIISSILFIFGDKAKIGLYGSRTSLRILGTSTDPNEFAGLFVISSVVCMYHIVNSKGKKRYISIFAFVLGMYSVLLSGSRGALISCFISTILTILFCSKISIKTYISFFVISIVVIVFFMKYLLPLVPIDVLERLDFHVLMRDGGGGRSALWTSGFVHYLDGNFLRIIFGYGANGLEVMGERGATLTLHNYYLQVLFNFGVIGFFIFMHFIWRVFRKFLGCNKKYAVALLGMMILAATLTTTPNYKPLWILMMLSFVPSYNLKKQKIK